MIEIYSQMRMRQKKEMTLNHIQIGKYTKNIENLFSLKFHAN